MNPGEKLRRARLDAGLTQAELCGGRISRNMLSLVENGAANPSLATLEYLAGRLGIPLASLFEDEEDAEALKRARCIGKIRSEFALGHWQSCIELCSAFAGREDDEIGMLLSFCFYHTGGEECSLGNLDAARNSFETAVTFASRTCYPCVEAERCSKAYIKLLDGLDFSAGYPRCTCCFDEYELLHPFFRYFSLLDGGMQGGIPEVLTDHSSPIYLHLCALGCSDMQKRAELLCEALGCDPAALPKCRILYDLEAISLDRRDYESAYSYAERRKALLEKFGAL